QQINRNGYAPREMKMMTEPRTYPEELSPDLAFILGMPNFQCAPIAHALRAGGADIATRSEAEQAYVLHWLIKLAIDHPADWRKRVGDRLAEIAAIKAAEASA